MYATLSEILKRYYKNEMVPFLLHSVYLNSVNRTTLKSELNTELLRHL